MHRNERVNDMYSRLNVLVEEIKALNVKKVMDEDVVRKIISILPRSEYQVIAMFLHQEDLERMTPWILLEESLHMSSMSLTLSSLIPLHQARTFLLRSSM